MAASAKAQVAQALNPARHPSSRDGAAAASPSPTATRTTVTVVLVMYCASGTMMTLANKLAVRLFPFPNAIACLQNCVTVALLSMGAAVAPATFGAMPKLTRDTLRDWLPLTSLFVGMLVSSLLALMHVSAVTLIVIRNLTSLTVAALEAAVLGTRVPPAGVASLAGMLVGATMYGLHDITFSPAGYAWLAVNLASTSAYQVHVKRVISSDAARAIGPLGFSYINNVLSLPMLVLVAVASGEPGRMVAAATSGAAAALLLTSGVLGFCLSVTAFKLNTIISATSMMVANNVNKVNDDLGGRQSQGRPAWGGHSTHTPLFPPLLQFLVIIASEAFIQRTLDAVATSGTLAVTMFGWLYSRARK
jgi:GDP-mannose transporter